MCIRVSHMQGLVPELWPSPVTVAVVVNIVRRLYIGSPVSRSETGLNLDGEARKSTRQIYILFLDNC